jgi:hypothetical protein
MTVAEEPVSAPLIDLDTKCVAGKKVTAEAKDALDRLASEFLAPVTMLNTILDGVGIPSREEFFSASSMVRERMQEQGFDEQSQVDAVWALNQLADVASVCEPGQETNPALKTLDSGAEGDGGAAPVAQVPSTEPAGSVTSVSSWNVLGGS